LKSQKKLSFVLFYIAVAAGAVTHADLLLENPVKLPFLSIELPVLAFFFLAPLLFLITHAYTLVHFVLLAKKAGRFHNELRKQIPDSSENPKAADMRTALQRQLPSNVLVQFRPPIQDHRMDHAGRGTNRASPPFADPVPPVSPYRHYLDASSRPSR
jgi:hypothetical protein